jgi:hypothetical protein
LLKVSSITHITIHVLRTSDDESSPSAADGSVADAAIYRPSEGCATRPTADGGLISSAQSRLNIELVPDSERSCLEGY